MTGGRPDAQAFPSPAVQPAAQPAAVILPRVLIAAPSSGQGKTIVATGLMAALADRGHRVSGHKVGPDYLDPTYHAAATGRAGRNLDAHLVGAARVAPLLLHGAAGADIAVIEGVMGLFDGRVSGAGFASSAHVAALTGSPVILVIDCARLTRSAAAIALGMVAFDPGIAIAGVIANRVGSPRHTAEIAQALAGVGIPLIGAVPRDDRLSVGSRHLGLMHATERAGGVRQLGEILAEHVDLAAIVEIAKGAPALRESPWDPAEAVGGRASGVVAIAAGPAFTFRYSEVAEMLAAAGLTVAYFDPSVDRELPAGTSALYLGGGYPELHRESLSANTAMRRAVAEAVGDGLPTVAECGGALYLSQSLDGAPMVGAVPAQARMTSRRTLRYPIAIAAADSVLGRAGERVSGHEFHCSVMEPESGRDAAWKIDEARTGFATATMHASYLHTHWAGSTSLARAFVGAVGAVGAAAAISAIGAAGTELAADSAPACVAVPATTNTAARSFSS